jgi:hypothetical protein
MPEYAFKVKPEAVWFVATAIATAVLELVNGAPPEDYRTWLIAVGAAAVRAGVGALLHVLNGAPTPPTVTRHGPGWD